MRIVASVHSDHVIAVRRVHKVQDHVFSRHGLANRRNAPAVRQRVSSLDSPRNVLPEEIAGQEACWDKLVHFSSHRSDAFIIAPDGSWVSTACNVDWGSVARMMWTAAAPL